MAKNTRVEYFSGYQHEPTIVRRLTPFPKKSPTFAALKHPGNTIPANT